MLIFRRRCSDSTRVELAQEFSHIFQKTSLILLEKNKKASCQTEKAPKYLHRIRLKYLASIIHVRKNYEILITAYIESGN